MIRPKSSDCKRSPIATKALKAKFSLLSTSESSMDETANEKDKGGGTHGEIAMSPLFGGLQTQPLSRVCEDSAEDFLEPASLELEVAEKDKEETLVPDMWSLDYVGLYCQYASVGLIYG